MTAADRAAAIAEARRRFGSALRGLQPHEDLEELPTEQDPTDPPPPSRGQQGLDQARKRFGHTDEKRTR